MIGLPFNDHQCLGAITQILAAMVAERDPALVELAAQYPTTNGLIQYLRCLPQRDDLGDPDDGPRVHACAPPQRVRIGAPDPNCVERAAVFLGVEELNHPEHTRQLATVDTPVGLHTFPLVDGRPIVLDPRVTGECLACGVALSSPGPVAVEPRNAVAWTIDLAQQRAGELRNGGQTLYVGKNAIRRLLDEGAAPARPEIDAMGALFALAERAAERYGERAIGLVRVAAHAIADVLDVLLAQRNARFDLGPIHFDTPQWLDDTAGALGNVGMGIGSAYLRSKLDALDLAGVLGLPGGTAAVIGLLESELGKSGRTLGDFAHPPALATFAKFAGSRTA